LHKLIHNDEVRRITNQPNLTALNQSRLLSTFGHIARMDDKADAKMILTVPPPNNWKRPPARSESLQPQTERSSRPGPEPSSAQADVYVWRYALLVVHAIKEEKVG